MSYQIDHRQLANEMEIFFFDEQIGAGLPVWLPNGVAIREALESFIKKQEQMSGYERVVSPHIGKESLFECSGHLRSFVSNMFPPLRVDHRFDYYLRPMNCPYHHKVFSALPRSYRHLPLRIAEYGQVYRHENSGSLRGLVRARGLCQNDAHIYVNRAEAKDEIKRVIDLHEYCYAALGLKGYRYRLSKHDPQNAGAFDGAPKRWIECESILREALIEKNLLFFEAAGEAAFYGPKIDVQMKVGPSKEESIASIQLDFNSAEKFDLKYVASSGAHERPWIIHRAPLGSHERFVSLLLEYYNGQLPGWLSPIQVYLLPIGEKGIAESNQLARKFIQQGIRSSVDANSGSLSKRILYAHRFRPFVIAVVGSKELANQSLVLQFRERKEICEFKNIVEALKRCLSPPANYAARF